jgi:hypothetical protein
MWATVDFYRNNIEEFLPWKEVRAMNESRIERWLREEVIAGHEEYMADPTQGVSAKAILDRIKARHHTCRGRGGAAVRVGLFKDEV